MNTDTDLNCRRSILVFFFVGLVWLSVIFLFCFVFRKSLRLGACIGIRQDESKKKNFEQTRGLYSNVQFLRTAVVEACKRVARFLGLKTLRNRRTHVPSFSQTFQWKVHSGAHYWFTVRLCNTQSLELHKLSNSAHGANILTSNIYVFISVLLQ